MVIGGRNKYLINGVNANNTRVQDLFCSVGLNVNNPHFLIMQVSLFSTALLHVYVLETYTSLQYFISCNVSTVLGEDHKSSKHEATRGKEFKCVVPQLTVRTFKNYLSCLF